MAPMAGNLCKVDVYASNVLDSCLSDSWQHARNFGEASWWLSAGHGEFAVKRLGPRAVAEIGCERMFSIGHARLFEELSALDDMEHIMRWVLVSHPSTVSPFGQASFLNYTSSIQLRAVTMTNQTFAEWRGQFWTEPQYIGQMEAIIQSWYFAGFKGLETCASGLEALDIPVPHQMSYGSDMMNPKYSVPIQPPDEQTAFHSPLEVRQYDSKAGSLPPSAGSKSSAERLSNGPGMATTSSQAWQAARAAFGGPPPSSSTRMSAPKSNPSPQRGPGVPQGPASTSSSAGSQGRARRTTDYEPAGPQNGHQAPPIGTSPAPPIGGSAHHSHLGSIQEGTQRPYAGNEMYAQGGRNEQLDRSTSNISIGQHSKYSSISSNQSNGSIRAVIRDQLRDQAAMKESLSFDGIPSDKLQQQRQGQPFPPRRSWQDLEDRRSQHHRPVSASVMKEEAMQKLNINPGQTPNDRRRNLRKNIQPDWASMKEIAYLETEHEAELMAGVAENMGKHHEQQTERGSFEETVAQLQERHKMLHGEANPQTEKPFVSPFSVNPFAAAQPVLSED